MEGHQSFFTSFPCWLCQCKVSRAESRLFSPCSHSKREQAYTAGSLIKPDFNEAMVKGKSFPNSSLNTAMNSVRSQKDACLIREVDVA